MESAFPPFALTALANLGAPVDQDALARALLGVGGQRGAQAAVELGLARTHVVQAVAVVRLGVDLQVALWSRRRWGLVS